MFENISWLMSCCFTNRKYNMKYSLVTSDMDYSSSCFPILFALFIFLIMLMKIGKGSRAKGSVSNLPPGPWKLPFIGNMHQMVGIPHRVLRDLAQKYGPLMYLQLGEVPAIVVSSSEVAKEIMKTHDVIFASRPSILAADIVAYDATDIAFAPYGENWRQLRKICALELLSMKRIQDFRPLREEEIGNLIKCIASNACLPVNLTDRVSSTNYSIISRLAFGGKFEDHAKFISVVTEVIKLASGFDIVDVFPSAKWIHFVSGTRTKLQRLHVEADQIMETIIAKHRKGQTTLDGSDKEAEQDLIDVLLKFEGSREQGFSLSTDNIKAVILDIFTGGGESSSMTVNWAMVEMIRNPHILKKAQSEVRRAFEKRGKFDDVALSELLYLKLVIKETLRLHPPAPLLLPRECRESCQINGYGIPFKAKVLVNAWAIGRDPKYWTDPEAFNPERFIDNAVDYRGNNFEYIPFGAGRRICPGMDLGVANVELFLAMLLYHFDWMLPTGKKPEDLNMDEAFGATARRKDDLYLVPTPYEPFRVN